MRLTPIRKLPGAIIGAVVVMAFGLGASAAEMTAFQLVKEGNRYIGEDARDKVSQIRSEKSVGTLTPNIWYIVYYDPDATAKATEVKFAAGQKISVKRPARVFELIGGSDRALPKDKLVIDSDRALEIAQKEPLVANLTLKASEMKLERWGDAALPVWKVRLWAAKLSNSNQMADIGEVFISADQGKVVKNDLRPNRVN
jgi:hypothetical protein